MAWVVDDLLRKHDLDRMKNLLALLEGPTDCLEHAIDPITTPGQGNQLQTLRVRPVH
jgi:hypothetical protein